MFVSPANPPKQGLVILFGQITGFQLRQPRARFHTNDLGVGDFYVELLLGLSAMKENYIMTVDNSSHSFNQAEDLCQMINYKKTG